MGPRRAEGAISDIEASESVVQIFLSGVGRIGGRMGVTKSKTSEMKP